MEQGGTFPGVRVAQLLAMLAPPASAFPSGDLGAMVMRLLDAGFTITDFLSGTRRKGSALCYAEGVEATVHVGGGHVIEMMLERGDAHCMFRMHHVDAGDYASIGGTRGWRIGRGRDEDHSYNIIYPDAAIEERLVRAVGIVTAELRLAHIPPLPSMRDIYDLGPLE